jgi:hypothetical protein
VEYEASTTVERGTILEELLGDMGFDEFLDMNVTEAEEIENQGVEPGDIRDVRVTEFTLEVTAPQDGDLSFLSQMAVYVEAAGLPEILVASQDSFPPGQRLVEFALEDVDLTEYAVSESLTLSTDVEGHRPDEDSDIRAHVTLDIGVTGQGACRAAEASQGGG